MYINDMVRPSAGSHFAGRCLDSRCLLYTCTLGSGSDYTTESLGWNVERWNRNRPRYRSLASWVTFTFTPGHSEMKPRSLIWGECLWCLYINPRSFSNKFCTYNTYNICPKSLKFLYQIFTLHIILLLAGHILLNQPLYVIFRYKYISTLILFYEVFLSLLKY